LTVAVNSIYCQSTERDVRAANLQKIVFYLGGSPNVHRNRTVIKQTHYFVLLSFCSTCADCGLLW